MWTEKLDYATLARCINKSSKKYKYADLLSQEHRLSGSTGDEA